MSENKSKGPIIDPGKCRCCGNIRKCRLLNVEYEFKGQPEMYSDMIVNCFSITLSHLDGKASECLICAPCVVRLRDARAFRTQVLHCEQRLLDTKTHVHEGEAGDDDDDVIIDDAAPLNANDDSYNTDDNKDSPPANQTTPKSTSERSAVLKDNALQNVITIVENSYVCPFTTVFSDYHCAYCDELFMDPIKLREHTLNHDPITYKRVVNSQKLTQIDVNRIDCRLCPAKIDNIDSFKTHITSVHHKVILPNEICEFLTFKLESSTVSCLECGKSFTHFHALKRHMAEHFGKFICDECGARYFRESLFTTHKHSHKHPNKDSRKYPCDECGKSFKTNYFRNIHITRVHKNEPAYQCHDCDEVFTTSEARLQHKIDIHGEKRALPCEVCHKIFNSRRNLNIHRKSHTVQYLYDCKFCDKKFKSRSGLRNHLPTHSDEMNFTCDYCGTKFSRAKSLKAHIESHHADKKYNCTLCSESYSQAVRLINHMKSKHPIPESSLSNAQWCPY